MQEKQNLEKVKLLARDLRDGKQYPRSPRETLGGYVIAARVLDKCRAVLAGTEGEYKYNNPMDIVFFEFAGITAEAFKDFVATGAADEAVGEWIKANAKQKERIEVVKWNNLQRYKTLRERPGESQLRLEDYIAANHPKGAVVYHWFDVLDIEEGRL